MTHATVRLATSVFLLTGLLGLTPLVFRGPMYEASAVFPAKEFELSPEDMRVALSDSERLASLANHLHLGMSPERLAARMRVEESVPDHVRISVRVREPSTGVEIVRRLSGDVAQERVWRADPWREEFLQRRRALEAGLTEVRRQLMELQWLAAEHQGAAVTDQRRDMLADRTALYTEIEGELGRVDERLGRIPQGDVAKISVSRLSPWPEPIQRGLVAVMFGLTMTWMTVSCVQRFARRARSRQLPRGYRTAVKRASGCTGL